MTHTEADEKDSSIGGRDSLSTVQSGLDQKPVRVLFVCIGNVCRSSGAEAIARHYGMGLVKVFSVGVRLVALDRRIVLVMVKMGIDISAMLRRGCGCGDQWT